MKRLYKNAGPLTGLFIFCFLVQPSGAAIRFSTLYNITGGDPLGLTSANGVLYGATWDLTSTGGNCGTVFELQPPATTGGTWTETVLYSFAGNNGDACTPLAAPIVGPNGVLFGVTYAGGAYGYGAVYEVQPPAAPGAAWTETLVYSFTAAGSSSKTTSNLILASNGVLYVAAYGGGAYGGGALLELQPPATPGGAWTETLLYSFPATLNHPTSLIAGNNGEFYGAIAYGGTDPTQAGAVFELTPPTAPGGNWTETLLYNFTGSTDGSTPNNVILGPNGSLYGTTYGTTYFGKVLGPYGVGTVYQLLPPASTGANWTKTILQQFGTGNLHGPNSPLILRSGNLYGTTSSSTGGSVFELLPPSTAGGAWTTTYLHNFTNGSTPDGALVINGKGTIYGVTETPAGQPFGGTIYQIITQ